MRRKSVVQYKAMEVTEQSEQKPIKKNGGARPNSGPKLGAKYKKTIAKEAATMYLIRRIEENIEPLATALIEKALSGETPALKEAFERGLGKVRDIHEIKGNLIIEIAGTIATKNAINTKPRTNSK